MSAATDKKNLLNNAKLLLQIRKEREKLVATELKARLHAIRNGDAKSHFNYEIDRAMSAAVKRALDDLLGNTTSSYSSRPGQLTQLLETIVKDAVTAQLASMLPTNEHIAKLVQQRLDATLARCVQRKLEEMVDKYVTHACSRLALAELENAEEAVEQLLEAERAKNPDLQED